MDTDQSWKESTARVVLRIVEGSGQADFTIDQVYHYEAQLQAQFPQNRHVREKMRQSLQKLVKDGLLLRTSRGMYRVNTASPEFEITTGAPSPGAAAGSRGAPQQLAGGNEIVRQVERIISVRLRNTLLAIELKRAYQYKCQVCSYAVPLRPPACYAEGHHLRPLGGGHNGPDLAGNILVLCPNHHTMFDTGAAAIEPESLRLVHWKADEFAKHQRLAVAGWHHLEQAHIGYHFTNIYQG